MLCGGVSWRFVALMRDTRARARDATAARPLERSNRRLARKATTAEKRFTNCRTSPLFPPSSTRALPLERLAVAGGFLHLTLTLLLTPRRDCAMVVLQHNTNLTRRVREVKRIGLLLVAIAGPALIMGAGVVSPYSGARGYCVVSGALALVYAVMVYALSIRGEQ